jgi:hypothetical protein
MRFLSWGFAADAYGKLCFKRFCSFMRLQSISQKQRQYYQAAVFSMLKKAQML